MSVWRHDTCWCFAIIGIGGTILTLALIIGLPRLSKSSEELEFTVTNASIAMFDFSPSNDTLSYDLSLVVVIRNPNSKGDLFFDRFEVIASYGDKVFTTVNVNSTLPFYLGRESKAGVLVVLRGRDVVLVLKDGDLEFYNSEMSLRAYSIDMEIALRLRNVTFEDNNKSNKSKSLLEPPKIECGDLKIPLSTSGVNFKATKCKNVYVFTSPKNGTAKAKSGGN